MKTMTIVPVVLVLAACASHLETRALDPITWRPDTTKPAVDGVVFFQPRYMWIRYTFSELVDSDGKMIGTAKDSTCKPAQQKDEIQIMPDFERPYAIRQAGSLLNSNKLEVTLASGLLTAVNSESVTKLPEVLTAVVSARELLTREPKGTKPACNAGPQISDFRPIKPGPPTGVGGH